jgi:hypothetical protein
LGGDGKIVEADETFIGGKSMNRAYKPPRKKEAVFALVERDGESRSFHVANVKAKTLREAIVKTADRTSILMTDEAPHYVNVCQSAPKFDPRSACNFGSDAISVQLGVTWRRSAEPEVGRAWRGRTFDV